MIVRELVALLGIKTDPKGQKAAEGGMNKLISLAKVAAAAFAAFKVGQKIFKMVEDVAKVGDQFDKLSLKTGIAFDTLQGLGHAAELAGGSIDDIGTAIKKLQAAQVDAGAGLKTYTREFDRLGIEIKDQDGNFKDATTLLFEVADGMQGLESDAEKTAVAVKLLGRAGTNLIPMLNQGSGAIREQMKEMEELGAVMGPEMRKHSVAFIDNQRRLDMMLQGIQMTLTQKLLPVFVKMQEATIKWWKANRPWIKQNIAPIFKGIAIAVEKTVRVFAKLVKWIVKFASNMPKEAKFWAIAIALMKWGKALKILLSPMGKLVLLIGLLVLIFDDLITWVEGGDSIFGRLFDTLDELTGLPIGDFMKEIVKWFMRLAEDPVAAFEELVGVIMESLQFWQTFFMEIWSAIVDWFEFNVVAKIMDVWNALANTLLFPWILLLNFFSDVFEVGVMGALGRLWTSIKEWADKVWNVIKSPIDALGKLTGWFGGATAAKAPGATGAPPPVVQGARTVLGGVQSPAQVTGAARARGGSGGASGGLVNAPTNTMSITVQGSPGMNEQKLSEKVGQQVRKELDRQNRQAIKALKPRVAAGV